MEFEFLTFDIADMKQAAVSPERVSQMLREQIRGQYKRYMSLDEGPALDAVSAMSIRNVEQVLAEMVETRYGPLKADRFITMGSFGVDPFTYEYVYERATDTGLADWIQTGDMPWADVETVEVRRRVHEMGGKVGWKFFELETARQGGKPLDTMKLSALRRSVDASRNQVMLLGDAGLPSGGGLITEGFFNDSSVPSMAAPNGALSGRTEDEIIEDMNTVWAQYDANVRETMQPNTMIVPRSVNYLLNRRLDGTSTSLREYLIDNLPGLENIEQAEELDTAGAGGSGRMVVYNRSPEVSRGMVVMPFRPFDPETRELQTTVCAAERQAGHQYIFPPGALYVDGVS